MPSYSLDIQDDSTIVLNVYEGEFKPYYYRGKAYKRNNSSTVEVERLELNRLILEGQNLTFENITSFKQDLSFTTLENELKTILGIKELTEDILRILDLYTSDFRFNNAATLLADVNSFKGIDIIRFGETEDIIMQRVTLENMSILSLLKKLSPCIKHTINMKK